MNFYSNAIKQGAKVIQEGLCYRDMFSKDGAKTIRQFIYKNGDMALDTYDNRTGKIVFQTRTSNKQNGSRLTKAYDYAKQKGITIAQQILGDGKAKMQVLLQHQPNQTPKPTGDFFHIVDKNLDKKGKVTYIPVNKSIMTPMMDLSTRVSIFNKLFGKIE